MDTELRRYGDGGGPATLRPAPLDYYLIFPGAGEPAPGAEPAGLVVEEFVLAEDHSAVGLDSAGWTPADGRWWSSAEFSRGMRADPGLRARVAPVNRGDAQAAYRRLGGGGLPDEPALRAQFRDRAPLADVAALRLDSAPVPDGFDERRVYRTLFARQLTVGGLARLRALWRMEPAGDLADPGARVIGTAGLRVSGDVFTWELRRIGADVAWCLDLTACLAGGPGHALGALLRELRAVMRQQGLVPVTVERFA
jgi:hypothetical protein